MSDKDPVDPVEVPVFTGNLVELDIQIKAISSGGTAVSTKAGDVHSSFGGLQAFYRAPEADQLFATTKPVSDLGLKLSTDMGTIAGALRAYARDVEPLKKKLENLKKEAGTFLLKVADDEKWREDGDLIDENLERRNKIAEVWAEFQAVERTAHAKIVALVGGKPLRVNDGSNAADMYGYDGEALKQAKSLPWGDAVEESVPAWQVWEHAWDFGKGVVVDGVWGTLKGLGGLVGLQGWDTFKQSWTGLAKLATGLAITAIPGVGPLFLAAPADKLPSWLRDSRTAMKETGKALLAWDQWGSNPSRAAGAVTFNVLTTVFTGGAGGAVSGAGKAGAVAKALSFAGKAGRAVDPMTYIFKGAGAGFSKIGDVMAALRGMGKGEIPSINIDGAVALPDGAKMLPDGTIHLPSGAAVPEGAIKLPNDTVKLPEGTTTFPPGTVKLPTDGAPQFMDPKGAIYDAKGNVLQRADQAPGDIADAPKADANTASGRADVGASPSGRPDADGNGSPGTAGAAASPSGRPDADGNTPSGRPDSGANAPKADAPKADSPATVKAEERVLVGAGVGGRGDDMFRLSSDMSDPVRTVGDHTPGPRPDTTPGGHAPDNMPRNSADTPSTGGRTDTPTTPGPRTDNPSTGGSGHPDSPAGGTGRTDSASTGGSHPDAPGAGGTHNPGDDAARTGHDAAAAPSGSSATGDAATGGPTSPRKPVERPSFMLDGDNPYGPRGRLTKEQIEQIQVYRANEEPGYRKRYYDKDGHRLRLSNKDESGYAPPQLTKLAPDAPWTPAKSTPEPPEPHYIEDAYQPLGREDVSDPARLNILDGFAHRRQAAIDHDQVVTKWKNSTGSPEAEAAYTVAHTAMGDAAAKFGEAAAEYHFMAEHRPGFVKQELLGPASGADQFDQVWLHPDGRAVIMEGKSSIKTRLGKRDLDPPPPRVPGVKGPSVPQGSKEYLFDIFQEMNKRGEKELVEKLWRARKNGRLEYIVVKGEINTGSYTGLQYRTFDTTRRTLP
ncbi:hypothetical protein HYE82_05500 [Streptomyces sp. BR123]|uniref:hypothetical protein n=1 Tax=Streptomyces sp. BR123 TaxID=2749828 RepID=UPI0015C4533D|nr:hypothetical protein [Streptomyces sp. BR123]NXY93857.1 hypothetical protein [Streptomyces sp. BR123]